MVWWYQVFPGLQLPDLWGKRYPILVGIMLRALQEAPSGPQSEYECQLLQRCDLLPKTNTRSTLENVVETLRTFKQEWHHNQQFLIPFDVVRSTGLCPDVVIEISKYLSLVDIINAFSIAILPLLKAAHAKIHLENPSSLLLQKVRQHLDPSQIASLRLTNDFQIPRHHLPAFQTFDRLTSVTVISENEANAIGYLRCYLPNRRHLSLWFYFVNNSQLFRHVRDLSFFPITRLQIRCTDNAFYQFQPQHEQYSCMGNTTITSFTFEMEYYPQQRRAFRWVHDSPDLVLSAFEFIGSLVNVRRVRFVTNRQQIPTFLQLNRWQHSFPKCVCLERVIVQLVDDGDFTEEAKNVEQEWRQLRPGIVFRIKKASLWFAG